MGLITRVPLPTAPISLDQASEISGRLSLSGGESPNGGTVILAGRGRTAGDA